MNKMLERKTLTTEVSHPEPVAKPVTKKLKRHSEQTGPAAAALSETVGGAATVVLTAEGPASRWSRARRTTRTAPRSTWSSRR